MKAILKQKHLILIIISIVVLTGIFLFVKTFLYSDYSKSVYGDRLNGIELVPVKQALKTDIVKLLKDTDYVKTASIDIRGKIINIVIDVKGTALVDNIKTTLNGVLEKFSDDQRQFYDIQFFVSQKEKPENKDFPMIGYKNKNSEAISWN